jgi:Arf-GAP with SH3 domain, ANK repeat and PH domain-containing protein
MDPIDLRLASVREARNSERRFCFEVITPNFKRVYQATSEEDMSNWINAINNALQSAFEGRGQGPVFDASTSSGTSITRDIGSVLTGKHSPYNKDVQNQSNGNANSVYRRTTVGARPSYIRTDSNSYNEDPTKLLQDIRERDQGNLWCADCNSNVKTEWVSINLGIVLCIECSGIHRSLGTHISKIRSLTLDTVSFTLDIVEIIMLIGNRISNQIWEAKLDQSQKPTPNATRDQRLKFITEKYVERLFIQPISSTLSHYGTSDETLIASVKKNDIEQVLYALSLRANPNATDKSRNTHVIFLALAAADPAFPQGNQSPATSPRTTNSQAKRIPAFPVAELLIQNGGELPTTLPAFPLSQSAQQYIEQKSAKTSDTLGALPNIKSPGNVASSDKERENKLQKRTSAGARFGGRTLGL